MERNRRVVVLIGCEYEVPEASLWTCARIIEVLGELREMDAASISPDDLMRVAELFRIGLEEKYPDVTAEQLARQIPFVGFVEKMNEFLSVLGMRAKKPGEAESPQSRLI